MPVIVLAFDTTTNACSAAVWRAGTVAARRHAAMERGQSEALVPMIEDVLAEAGIGLDAVDLIGVTVGPGAFTGVRIGLATARALGLAAGIPVRGVTTCAAIACAVPPGVRSGRSVLATVDSKRADLYVQLFGPDLAADGKPAAVMPDALGAFVGGGVAHTGLVVAGTAARTAADALRSVGIACDAVAEEGPDAAVVAAVAASLGPPEADAPPPAPLYVQPPHVRIDPTGGAIRPARQE